ncbi:DNA repair protein rad2 [Paramarasmius palmivorus]|uniref:DNA repair protein rad2 n=1 Tax=Paramarasmius palmivorus TaxID=297713 RepID=A0AAW0DHI2_9AGAR
MAIDSSIWIYQFQATMRAKDGRALVNAHVLGFLRRICKLLFYGIKPVFVFDGGAPALKKSTLNDRRRKKSGAAASHTKIAERLLAAQMRREALKHAKGGHSPSKGKGKVSANADEETVFLEDLDPTMPQTPAKKKKAAEPSSSGKKNKFYDHDPYRLPDVNMEARVADATRSAAPDPRLATEEELRDFIENMRPEDFDVTSAAFRELPTEIQYEIVGDLRLKSRQTSYTRLQQMLRSAPTPLDFSKQQIKNLQQRNSLTQQLLTTTDTIGKAHIEIPIRIASERNREYVLMKNEDASGGWILGIRDDGTEQKPIVIDHDSDDEDDDMEEVKIPDQIQSTSAIDPDLRNYQRNMALSAIGTRYEPKPLAPLTTSTPKPASIPLFSLDDEEKDTHGPPNYESDDEMVALAIQQSLDTAQARLQKETKPPSSSLRGVSPNMHFVNSTRLETALSIANASSSKASTSYSHYTTAGPSKDSTSSGSFGQPFLLNEIPPKPPSTSNRSSISHVIPREPTKSAVMSSSTLEPERPPPSNMKVSLSSGAFGQPLLLNDVSKPDQLNQHTVETHQALQQSMPLSSTKQQPISQIELDTSAQHPAEESPRISHDVSPQVQVPGIAGVSNGVDSDDDDMEEVIPIPTSNSERFVREVEPHTHLPEDELEYITDDGKGSDQTLPPAPIPLLEPTEILEDATEDQRRSHSPTENVDEGRSRPPSPPAEDWDAAQEMDPDAEEGEFARFVSQVKGRDIDDVRREIDEEIKSLNEQRKNAMRDSEDITQQMITQIMMMLRLFGIPYITAPMEAEAQCAALVSLGLVDGIITDDSDVFLFGGLRVYKNMFNQSKTVECFLLSDLSRELGLDRDTLIRLAYLLGSDYVEGLPGVGPVVAMELLKEFPGEDGLHKFKDWWSKVQTGRDKQEHTSSPFRQKFKKKFKNLYLPPEWPNSAVRDAYYHPTVDESDEPFKWGLPDLDALREFLREELGWGQSKVDDLLLPIIQKMNKRSKDSTSNKQGNLNEFFEVSGGSGTLAPRKRQAYASKRLQQVVADFRKKRREASSGPAGDDNDDQVGNGDVDNESDAELAQEPPAKRAKSSTTRKKSGAGNTQSTRGRGSKRGRNGRGGARGRGKRAAPAVPSGVEDIDDSDASEEFNEAEVEKAAEEPPPLAVNLRPRPKPKPAYRTATNAEAPTS